MNIPWIVYNLLFRPKNAQYINKNVYFVKNFKTFSDVFTWSSESLFLYMLKLQNQLIIQFYLFRNVGIYKKKLPEDVNTPKHVGVLYETNIVDNILCISV
jgi:hypothetical protein